jgi:hypothetical protein
MEDNRIFEKEPQWEQDSELRRIRKTIRRRNRKNIFVSVLLAAVLLVVTVFGILPWAESLYWNPDEITYRDGTDLEITLQAYTELFAPGYQIYWVDDQRTAFAEYELQIRMKSTARDEVFTARGTLNRNKLWLDDMFIFQEGKNHALGRDANGKRLTPSETEALRKQLSELPDFIRLEATVDFPEDLSMEELLRFHADCAMDPVLNDMKITWVAVDSGVSGCGMSFYGARSYPLVDLEYRCFSGAADLNQESLEHHFKSLLRYSADQVEKGRGIAPNGHESVYTEILDYVEENGVKTYGVVVTASPQALLKLMDSDRVYEIRLVDGWLDIG